MCWLYLCCFITRYGKVEICHSTILLRPCATLLLPSSNARDLPMSVCGAAASKGREIAYSTRTRSGTMSNTHTSTFNTRDRRRRLRMYFRIPIRKYVRTNEYDTVGCEAGSQNVHPSIVSLFVPLFERQQTHKQHPTHAQQQQHTQPRPTNTPLARSSFCFLPRSL